MFVLLFKYFFYLWCYGGFFFFVLNFVVVCMIKWLCNVVDFKILWEIKVWCKFFLIIMVKFLNGYFDILKLKFCFLGGDV